MGKGGGCQATPARATVAMTMGRAEAKPPLTYPIRARERRDRGERHGGTGRESLKENVGEQRRERER